MQTESLSGSAETSTESSVLEATKAGESLATRRPRIVQVEANLLQFPFFALQTKGLKERKGIEVVGRKNDQPLRLRVTRNMDTDYPGPLSRKLHFALLSILYERHHGDTPIENPVQFSWRELADRADLKWSGNRIIPRMKRAIEATHGVVIRTSDAMVTRSGSGKTPIPTRERGYHLYEKYYFANDVLPDETTASSNQIWLADWYLENLNSLYSGPVNYDLWLDLNKRPIASRLYEFLMYKFTANIPKLIINYETLTPFLPAKTEARLSWARKQLAPALQDLEKRGVVRRVDWTESRDGKIQLHFHPGPALKRERALPTKSTIVADATIAQASVRELSHSESPSEQLVRNFHRLWTGNSNVSPSRGELETARTMIGEFGFAELDAELKNVVNQMKVEFPTARMFSATARFVPQVIEARRKDQTRRERERRQQAKEVAEEEERLERCRQRRERRMSVMAQWQKLSLSQREDQHTRFLESIKSDVVRTYQAGKSDLANPTGELLDYFAARQGVSTLAC